MKGYTCKKCGFYTKDREVMTDHKVKAHGMKPPVHYATTKDMRKLLRRFPVNFESRQS